MKILVTGASGFLGRHLVKQLLEKGHEVICISRKTQCLSQTIYTDIKNRYNMKKLPYDVDCIFHLAASVFPNTKDDPRLNILANSLATLNLLHYAHKNDVKRFIYASTVEVYGSHVNYLPIDEKHPVFPDRFYGASKYGGEIFCNVYKETYNVDIVILRFAYIYGIGMNQNLVVPLFLNNAINGNNLTLFDGGMDTYDFIYVSDAVQACLKALTRGSEIYNIASGTETSIRDLAKTVIDVTKSRSKSIYKKSDKSVISTKRFYFDIAKARNELKFTVNYPLIKGIQEFHNLVVGGRSAGN